MIGRKRGGPSEQWDGGEWVDVGNDGRWSPSFGTRLRSGIVLLLALVVLLVAAAVASVDDGEDEPVATASTVVRDPTSSTTVPTTQADPASLAGEPTPQACLADLRDAAPLRDRILVHVLALNGTSRGGHAGAVTDDLQELGYATIVPSNAGRRSTTLIEYTPGYCAEGVRLLLDLGIEGVEIGPLAEDSDVFIGRAELLVTLGSDSL